MNKSSKLGQMPIPQLVLSMSWPLMVSLLVQSLYNIVDSVFVAMLSQDALTATSLAFPIQILMIAVSVGTSVGINALLSKSIGAGDTDETGNTAATGVLLALAGAVVFMLLGFGCTGLFVSLFTQDAAIGTACREYLWVCMVFCGGTFIGTMYQRFLQAVGDTVSSMVTLVAGAVTNLVLDPILIFGLGPCPALGVRGAAIATVVGQWVTAVLAVWLNTAKNPQVQVHFHGFRLRRAVLVRIYQVGLPTILTQAMSSLMVLAVNAILMPFSSTCVAFFGVYYKLQNFLFMPMNGLGQAAIPIAGYNYGAKQYPRIRALLRFAVPLAAGIALAASAVFALFPAQLLSIFNAGDEMLAIGIPALRTICGTFALAAVTMILGYTVSGLGNGVVNMLGTALRQVILLVPGMYLLARMGGVGMIWYAFWPAEIVAAVYALLATRRVLKEKNI